MNHADLWRAEWFADCAFDGGGFGCRFDPVMGKLDPLWKYGEERTRFMEVFGIGRHRQPRVERQARDVGGAVTDKHLHKAEVFADNVFYPIERRWDRYTTLDPFAGRFLYISLTRRIASMACDRGVLRGGDDYRNLADVHALLEDDKEPSQ